VSRVSIFEEITNWVSNLKRLSNWMSNFQISRWRPATRWVLQSSSSSSISRIGCWIG
jgi:hypothetical protein